MKFSKLRNSPWMKATLLTGGLTVLFQILSPTVSLALTGGPQQPEFQGFVQIDTGNMVDPFTGDFKYQIPLMTIPGPNGGYPLNLTYAAGPSLEEEASWVGLGWNLNAGAVNRQMRGVPDDFNEDPIKKKNYIKPNTTVGFGIGVSFQLQEAYGADLGVLFSVGQNSQFYMNNYTGFGYRNSISTSFGLTQADNESSAGLTSGLSLNFDSNEGADVQPSFGLKARDGSNSYGIDYGFGYSGRQGFQGHYLSASYNTHSSSDPTDENDQVLDSYSYSYPFALATGVPRTSMPMLGGSFSFSIKPDMGAADQQFKIPISFQGRFSQQKMHPLFEEVTQSAYGLYYAGEAPENGLMDYNIEKDAPINAKLPNLPIPVSTHDIYSVQASQLNLSFRNYRNDMGLFYEPGIYSITTGGEVGVEAGSGTGFKIGVNARVSFATSYSGPWKGNAGSVLEKFDFRGSQDENALLFSDGKANNRFSYFKVSGEQTADLPGSGFRMAYAGGTFGPVKFPINSVDQSNPQFSEEELGEYDGPNPFTDVQKFSTGINPQLGNQAYNSNYNNRRQRQNTLIEHRTKKEVLDHGDGILKGNYKAISPILISDTSPTFSLGAYDFEEEEDGLHHMAEFSVLEPGGLRYTFGLPAYNQLQRDVVFAVSVAEGSDATNAEKLVDCNQRDKIRNFQGRDQYFSSTELPAYTHSHLLTLITSPDYVDVTNDGPSEDDYGYYTKFNYYKAHSNYKWRTPYDENKANHHKGFYSSALDNKASYNYGEKEIWYVHSIETKTHVAVFVLDERQDAYGTAGPNGGLGTQKLKCLKEIRLYAKKQIDENGNLPEKPIKTVHFEYSYELCQGIPNNVNAENEEAEPNTTGKLTLKKVYFSYNGHKRGELNAYLFDYANNPDYDPMQSDRWGNYRPDAGNALYSGNEENPYVNQEESSAALGQRSANAGAWSVTRITTPSNAVLEMEYEPDDYAYVQDKRATQMFQIIGSAKTGGSPQFLDCPYVENELGLTGEEHIPISQGYTRLYFMPERSQTELAAMNGTQRDAYIKAHVGQLTDQWLYFKAWERIQRPKNRNYWAKDYVTGYAKVDPNGSGFHNEGGKWIPYITVQETTNDAIKNPLQLAGLQYLRYSRGDLNMPQDPGNGAEAAITLITSGLSMILSLVELIQGYYTFARKNNYCKYIESERPSFIKMCTPDGKKYGGGHRVKSITVRDGWNETSQEQDEYTYKQDYRYTAKNGESSGVASYEPALGNDENALKYPYYYSPDNKYNNDPAFLTEAPFNEAYFPAPVVGYSRMMVRSDINHHDPENETSPVKATGDAIRVYEFYTAKDYPVISENTPVDVVQNKLPIPIPLVGGIQITNNGYSQGYKIELNDMHGKPKAEYTYAASAWDYDNNKLRADAPFVSSKEYKYNTEGGYSPTKKNRVNSVLQVLDSEGITRAAVVGETAEVFSNLREDSGVSISAGLQLQAGVDVLPYMLFISGYPGFDYSESTARTAVTNKIIYKTGLLTETVERMEGAVKTTSNLLYDAENGQPLLTAVTTDYDDHTNATQDAPIYTYTMPAHWYYEGMQASYKNYRIRLKFQSIAPTAGEYPLSNAGTYLEPGDEVDYLVGNILDQKLWVNSTTSSGFKLITQDGSAFTGTLDGELVVVRSGHRNLQNQTAGTIVALTNPITGGLPTSPILPVLQWFNTNVYNNDTPSAGECLNDPCAMENSPILFVINPFILETDGSIGFFVVPNAPCTPGSIGENAERDYIPCLWKFTFTDIGNGVSDFLPTDFNKFRLYHTGGDTDGYAIYDLGNGQTLTMGLHLTFQNGSDPDLNPCILPGKCEYDILDAKAIEYKNEWEYTSDFAVASENNAWLTLRKGIWRVQRTNTYFVERLQDGNGSDFKSYIGRDGTYKQFLQFNWASGNENNAQMENGWRWAAEVPHTGYGRGGFELENKNALGIYSSELFGFNQSTVIGVAANARYHEIGVESFERPGITTSQTSNVLTDLQEETNHIGYEAQPFGGFGLYGDYTLSNEKSHSGLFSLKMQPETSGFPIALLPLKTKVLNPGTAPDPTFKGIQLQAGKKYLMSYWFNNGMYGSSYNNAAIALSNSLVTGLGTCDLSESIEGWRKITIEFTAPPGAGIPFQLVILAFGDEIFIDDIRIHPVDASFKSYVYDPLQFKLKAELDDNNYATFYNYNLEGNLVQVKKETREGIKTIRTTRKYVKPNNE